MCTEAALIAESEGETLTSLGFADIYIDYNKDNYQESNMAFNKLAKHDFNQLKHSRVLNQQCSAARFSPLNT
jgi:hypothetical protein